MTHHFVKNAALAFLLILFVYPAKAAQGENPSQQKRPDSQRKVAPPTPTVTPADNANVEKPQAPIQQAERDNEQAEPVSRAEKIQIGINAFVALVILWQTFIYVGQRRIMQQQREMSAISERAYLGFVNFEIRQTLPDGLVISAVIENGGRTPAFGIEIRTQVSLLPAGTLPPVFPWDKCPSGDQISFIPAGSKRNVDFVNLENVDQKAWNALYDGSAELFADGEIRYKDHVDSTQVFAFGLTFDMNVQEHGGQARTVDRYQHYQKANPK
jgi:hypothetical protein